jgi:hypothetical protein
MADLLNEMDRVVLAEDLSAEDVTVGVKKGLPAGTEGLVVDVRQHGRGGYTGPDGYTVEFRSESGGRFPNYQLVHLSPEQVRPADEP